MNTTVPTSAPHFLCLNEPDPDLTEVLPALAHKRCNPQGNQRCDVPAEWQTVRMPRFLCSHHALEARESGILIEPIPAQSELETAAVEQLRVSAVEQAVLGLDSNGDPNVMTAYARVLGYRDPATWAVHRDVVNGVDVGLGVFKRWADEARECLEKKR